MNVQHRTSNIQHRIKKQTSNTEYSITPRRDSMFILLLPSGQKQLSAYGAMEEGLSLEKNRIADYLTSNNCYNFTLPYLMKYERLIQRFSGNYRGTIVLYGFLSFPYILFIRNWISWNFKNLSYLQASTSELIHVLYGFCSGSESICNLPQGISLPYHILCEFPFYL